MSLPATPVSNLCRVASCSEHFDGDDRLCGYHRALQHGPAELERFRASGEDWRRAAFAEFDAHHQDDEWGVAVRLSHNLKKGEARRELLQFLKRKLQAGSGLPLPYDPRQTAAEIEFGTPPRDHQRATSKTPETVS